MIRLFTIGESLTLKSAGKGEIGIVPVPGIVLVKSAGTYRHYTGPPPVPW